MNENKNIQHTDALFSDLCSLIDSSKNRVAVFVNSEVILMNWHIGKRIKENVLHNKRAEYGKEVIKNISLKLTEKYGKGWGEKHLQHCLRSAEAFSEEEIHYAMRRQLSWTHIRTFSYIEDSLKRLFYIELCIIEHWNTRTLDKKIGEQLYERTAISKKPENIIKAELSQIRNTQQLTPDLVFRNTYFLNMLGLPDIFSEKDLETAILNQIQDFIKELGTDFAFLDRQKRITIDQTDYFMDLLFYHRGLRRLVVIELKLGKFKPEYEGQMLLYLRYLDKNERRENEDSPIGLILCSEGNTEHIEYFMLEDSNIKVAQYYTQLPDKKLLQEKLHRAIQIAKEISINKK